MKRLITCLLFIYAICLPSFPQGGNGYEIFKIEGTVKMKVEGEWSPAERRKKVSLRNLVQVSEGSRIGLLETSSGRIYYMAEPGTYTVAKLISEARKQADAHIKEVNSRVAKAVAEKGDNRHSYAIAGAVHRGTGSDDAAIVSHTQAVYEALVRQFSSIDNGKKRHAPKQDIKLSWQSSASDGSQTPRFENLSANPLYFTLLRIVAKSPISVEVITRFGKESGIPSLLVASGGAEPLTDYLFAAEVQQATEWILIASDNPFDSQLLQQLLQRNTPTQTAPCPLHLTF